MSLWTPSGEHPVARPGRAGTPPPGAGPRPGASPTAPAGTGVPGEEQELTPEEQAQLADMSRQVEEARRQLLQAPAGPVVGQQALQFYELAALHLSQPEPRLDDARIAIDALGAVVERLGSRLGEAETPLRQALHQLQMAYVEVSRRAPGGAGDPGDAGRGPGEGGGDPGDAGAGAGSS